MENIPQLSPEELDLLTEEERNSLLAVLEKAREFDRGESEASHKPIEGQLLKWTNVVKGWQMRWFYLSPDVGLLHYFLSQDKKMMGPRGSLKLAGAIVTPSDEDSQTFSVIPKSGELFKLRAPNAKGRQAWIDRIRRVIEKHTTDLNTLVKAAAASMPVPAVEAGTSSLARNQSIFRKSKRSKQGPPSQRESGLTPRHLVDMNIVLHSLNSAHRNQVQIYQFCEDSESFADPAVLTYKANAQALFKLLDECYNIINQLKIEPDERERSSSHNSGLTSGSEGISRANSVGMQSAINGDTTVSVEDDEIVFSDTYNHITDSLNYENGGQALSGRSSSLSSNEVEKEMETATSGTFDTVTSAEFVSAGSETSTVVRSGSITSTCQVTLNWEAQEIDSESGEQYDMAYEEGDDDVADLGEHKSVIMSLLGQLKLGMDLTKVVLPTFILERKSLLETFANCFSHPDIFMSISDGRSPEERILRATKWLLTSFHAGRKGSIAKKPYNPIIGEIFNCAWNVDTRNGARPQCIAPNQVGDVTFLAEQVSHHPPISAFYAECKDKKICANYSVWTKSKFLGISVGVDMVGVGTISLLEHGEQYHFTLPSTYGRSILTVPWSEMGGKVQINCPQTDYTSTLIFHTKPMYGGKMHRVNGDIKDNMTGKMLYKLDGEWNGKMKFTDECEGISELVDTEILSVIKKDITPISKQKENESRRLWKDVTIALKKNDIEEATAAKFKLEQRQREEGAYRAANNIEWAPTHFKPDGDNWLYKKSIAGEREP